MLLVSKTNQSATQRGYSGIIGRAYEHMTATATTTTAAITTTTIIAATAGAVTMPLITTTTNKLLGVRVCVCVCVYMYLYLLCNFLRRLQFQHSFGRLHIWCCRCHCRCCCCCCIQRLLLWAVATSALLLLKTVLTCRMRNLARWIVCRIVFEARPIWRCQRRAISGSCYQTFCVSVVALLLFLLLLLQMQYEQHCYCFLLLSSKPMSKFI